MCICMYVWVRVRGGWVATRSWGGICVLLFTALRAVSKNNSIASRKKKRSLWRVLCVRNAQYYETDIYTFSPINIYSIECKTGVLYSK